MSNFWWRNSRLNDDLGEGMVIEYGKGYTKEPRRTCCHLGDLVYASNWIEIYGAAATDGAPLWGYDVIVNLTNTHDKPPMMLGKYASIAQEKLEPLLYIHLATTDYAPPPVSPMWVNNFIEILRQIHKDIKRPIRILVYCVGGHGRTGTFIAILLKALGITDPIRYVRQNYCKKAIETKKQENFVKNFDINKEEVC